MVFVVSETENRIRDKDSEELINYSRGKGSTIMKKQGWNRSKLRSKTALGLAVLMAWSTVMPSFSAGDEIHLINDLGGYGGESSVEAQAERDWNEDIVSVAKSAWYDAHAGEDFEDYIASGSNLRNLGAATGSDLTGGSVFDDVDTSAAASAVSNYLKKAKKEEKAKSGEFLRKMLKEAAIPEEGVPRESDLKKEIIVLDDMSDEDFVILQVDDDYTPEAGDMVFVAGRIGTTDESPASSSDAKKADAEVKLQKVEAPKEEPIVISEATGSDLIRTEESSPEIAETEVEILNADTAAEAETIQETPDIPAENTEIAESAAPADAVPETSAAIENVPETTPEEIFDVTELDSSAARKRAVKNNAKKAVLGGIVIAGPAETGNGTIEFIYSTGTDKVEIGVISAAEPRIIGYADMENLHDKYCGILEEKEEELEELEEETVEETLEVPALEEVVPNTKTKYSYSDALVTVTAEIADPDAIPDDAEFKVTAVNRKTSGYNYEAYMDALNASDNHTYTADNTLLYDIAFLAAEKDEDGNETGRTIELQPEEGSVKVSFKFNKKQLTEELGVKHPEDLVVHHMPLKEGVKEENETTRDARNISAADIEHETLQAYTMLGTNTGRVEFETTGLSLVGFSYTVDYTYDGYQFSMRGGTSMLLSELFTQLHISENVSNVKNVTFTNEELLTVKKQDNADWLLTSLKAFTSEETLTVEMQSGEKYVIEVRDIRAFTKCSRITRS